MVLKQLTKFTRTFWKQEDGSDQMRKVLTIDLVHVRSGDDEEDWMDERCSTIN